MCTSNYASDSEVRDALGEALYSRSDAVIPFRELSGHEVGQVIDHLLKDRVDRLDDDEKVHVDLGTIRAQLQPLTTQTSNIRQIGKRIDEVLALVLVQSLFSNTQEDEADEQLA